MKKSALLFFAILLSASLNAQNLLPEMWKFKTGDDPQWASPAFDDSDWTDIKAGIQWESQGFNGYDGYAWYRVTFMVPADLELTAIKYGGLNLALGKIDDVDFTYLNGKLVGGMGELPPHYETAWNMDRNYRVPAGLIHWGQENTIAVRVFDLLGGGGIYSRPIQFTVRGVADYLTVEPKFSTEDHIFSKAEEVDILLDLKYESRKVLEGNLSLKVISDFGKEIANLSQQLTLDGKGNYPVSFLIPGIEPGFYKATAVFESPLAYKTCEFAFGCEPEAIVSPTNPAPDFESFWDRARQELATVDPKFKVTKIDSLSTSKRNVYLVEMRSLGNVLIRGWYTVPAKPGKYPAIMQVPGYSGSMIPEYVDYGDEIIGFGLNIRGHGNSQDDFNPGFPGYLFSGIKNQDTYVYRGAYMDCLRGIDFLYSRPEVDTTRVAVEGGSQGGALTYATAALDNRRIIACAPLVPFLSDFEDYFKVAPWPGNEFIEYVQTEYKMTWEEVFSVLSYFDIKNLAGWINCPLFMGVGLVDDVCPPHINFAAYNQVKSEKHYVIYPYAGHGLPADFYDRRMVFLREKLGLE